MVIDLCVGLFIKIRTKQFEVVDMYVDPILNLHFVGSL